MHPLESYLTSLRDIHHSGGGTDEESYYGALETLFNEIGNSLKPRVLTVPQLHNTGAGEPDFGLFEKIRKPKDMQALRGLLPERGVVEVKGWEADLETLQKSEQVKKYFEHYRLVLITNYRQFMLLAEDASGNLAKHEDFTLADTPAEFAGLIQHPRKAAGEHGAAFDNFLVRVMETKAKLVEPERLAAFLASYAKDARNKVEARKDLPQLKALKTALEEALGMTFGDDKNPRKQEEGEHFFRATLVQTLFYGLFSAWVLWARKNKDDVDATFDWQKAEWFLDVPMINSLFEQISSSSRLKDLDIVHELDMAGLTLNRVRRGEFFEKFAEEHAVQYFYEPFLQAYDSDLRKQYGVWYTPPEIVTYQVERVDQALREELNIPTGLADENVVVLDPCCGTGAYLVEVLDRIKRTLEDNSKSPDTIGAHLKKAATTRVFGFEIMPAPYVISHLQLGMRLREHGAGLNPKRKKDRVGVYLTNALTGWEPLKDPKHLLPFPDLKKERDQANEVKRDKTILVILGNPPYNGFASVAIDEERALSTAYRKTILAPAPIGRGTTDLYVRFYRMAERKIIEGSKRGVISFISNYSWLDGLSFTGMRERFFLKFNKIFIDNLNGDKYKTGKLTPTGEPDPSVFSTKYNREGIQVGTSVNHLIYKGCLNKKKFVLQYREFWGNDKLKLLVESLDHSKNAYSNVNNMSSKNGYVFMPMYNNSEYELWPLLEDIFPVSYPGVITSRDDFLISQSKAELEDRVKLYFNNNVTNEELKKKWPVVMTKQNRYDPVNIRNYLISTGIKSGVIMRYFYRPLDTRWIYYVFETKLLDEKRLDYYKQVFDGNLWIEARKKQSKLDYDRGIPTKLLSDNMGSGISRYFPLYINESGEYEMLDEKDKELIRINMSSKAQDYCSKISADEHDVYYHVITILRTPCYQKDNSNSLRLNWPRIPLPSKKEDLLASAALGEQVAALLDTEDGVDGVTRGPIRDELKPLGMLHKVPSDDDGDEGRGIQEGTADLELTAGWGHFGKGKAVMPGRGRVETITPIDDDMRERWGDELLTIWLNDRVYWSHVPKQVWDFYIGGYQVIKKWLSYREKRVLDRGLTMQEAEYVTEMVRRLAALVLLQPELDANYERVKADTYDWPSD